MTTFHAISLGLLAVAVALIALLGYNMCHVAARADRHSDEWADFDRKLLRSLEHDDETI